MRLAVIRGFAFVALLFLGITAVISAVPMLIAPRGAPWAMPQSFLAHSPFHSYFIPGVILLFCNGGLSFVVLVLAMRRQRLYGGWIAFQGTVLAGWLLVEVVVLRFVIWAHWFYGGLAAILIVLGWTLRSDARPGYTETPVETKEAVTVTKLGGGENV